jgi:signal transduction histidine kinase
MAVGASYSQDINHPKYRVLVVDDEREIVQQIKLRFEFEGFEVLEAFNGKDARAIVDQLSPDVVITDIRMPQMTGYDLIRSLQLAGQQSGDVPIVICMSGYSDVAMGEALESGASAYFAKPIDPGDLVAVSRNFIGKRHVLQSLVLEAESLREEAARNAAAADQIGIQFVHELKNHVTSIVSTLQRVLLPSNLRLLMGDPKVKPLIEAANRKGWELNEIINTVYSVYSSEGSDIKEESLPNLLDGALRYAEEYVRESGVSLRFEGIKPQALVRCAPFAVRQILFNFFKNSIDAMSGEDVREITITSGLDRDFAYVWVNDTGPGLSESEWARVFDAGFSTGPKNLGIGLTFAIRAAQAFGGDIRFEKAAKGARIRLAIPLAKDMPGRQ